MLGRLHRIAAQWRLSAIARAVRRDRLTYLSPTRLARLESALSEVLNRGTIGDIVEFGVALGGTAIVLADFAKRHGRRFCGFDVFGMMPPPTSDKDDTESRLRYDVIASGQRSGIGGDTYYGYRQDLFDDVLAAFARHGISVDNRMVVLYRGLFQETWSGYNGPAVALAHIDCHWYDPVKFCLEQLADRVSSGGVVILDDYNEYSGCRSATDEFLSTRPDFRMENDVTALLRRSGSCRSELGRPTC